MSIILGIWDGHDSGAAFIDSGKILYAANEERFTRRKLEVRFPALSIKDGMARLGISPRDIQLVSVSTWDPAKTIGRINPATKEKYYMIRRRKAVPNKRAGLIKRMKYSITTFKPNLLSRASGMYFLRRQLTEQGLGRTPLEMTSHHLSHAAVAGALSGWGKALVITLDGIGDGLAGSVNLLNEGKFREIAKVDGRHSPGIFFEHVTNLLNMRELEDEGKVMALANYARPVEDSENPLLEIFRVKGLEFRCQYQPWDLHQELKKILWRFPSEQFAYMAQRALEVMVSQWVKNAVNLTAEGRLALAGGVFANVKLNMLLRHLPGVQDIFICPHMGDGGLALGAALAIAEAKEGLPTIPINEVQWGPNFSNEAIEAELKRSKVHYERPSDIVGRSAELLAQGQIVLWFQGRMEWGPRALGNRSILARADREEIKERLNQVLKKRVWYQPFCPSMLDEEANELLENYDGKPNRFMTMAYRIRPGRRANMAGVINIDETCRPQMVGPENPRYQSLLRAVKRLIGYGVLLNTSFNIHGEPVVCSPADALRSFTESSADYMAIGDFLVIRKA